MSTRSVALNKVNTLSKTYDKDLSSTKELIMYLLKYDYMYSNVDISSIDVDDIALSYKAIFNDFKDVATRLDILHQEIRNELVLNNYKYNDYTRQYHYAKYN